LPSVPRLVLISNISLFNTSQVLKLFECPNVRPQSKGRSNSFASKNLHTIIQVLQHLFNVQSQLNTKYAIFLVTSIYSPWAMFFFIESVQLLRWYTAQYCVTSIKLNERFLLCLTTFWSEPVF
jgi:hypothetical protein